MQKAVPELDWQALWDFRRAYFPTFMLGELNGWSGPSRPGKDGSQNGRIFELDLPLRRLTHELG